MKIEILEYYFRIELKDQKRQTIKVLLYNKMTFEIRKKYDWYFKYRAALLQVQNPKMIVDVYWGNEPAEKTKEQQIKNRIKAKKAKITQYKNLLKKAETEWREIFPIRKDKDYIKAINKINRLEEELNCLEKEIKK